jgi:hypothetical protein
MPFETARVAWRSLDHGRLSQLQLVQALVGGQAAARSALPNLRDLALLSPRRATTATHV